MKFCNGFSNVCTIAFSTCITLFCIERAFVWKVTNLENPIGTVVEDKGLYFKFYFLHSNNHISDTNSTQKLQKQINCSPCLKLSPLDFENFWKVIKRGKPFLKRKWYLYFKCFHYRHCWVQCNCFVKIWDKIEDNPVKSSWNEKICP